MFAMLHLKDSSCMIDTQDATKSSSPGEDGVSNESEARLQRAGLMPTMMCQKKTVDISGI